ncbi:hypothetical protein BCR42DRAFT_420818 [Absidia repens]|uniref:C2H2-type domain-containing protein n=1 Tax=Absidia repens TaxID=90262 RepID=A0A1X2I8U8_9FUNG|nr:hypothetical protein BCR42DRAFT_420818 [Absidia repens]
MLAGKGRGMMRCQQQWIKTYMFIHVCYLMNIIMHNILFLIKLSYDFFIFSLYFLFLLLSTMALLQLYSCPQCYKKFATHSNLKRHTENPNIHNIPYKRSRDQKRWKNHAKKQVSKEETAQRMRKWRAANRDKNKRNDLRCRVYRLARMKFQDDECIEKELFIKEQISRRLGRQRLLMNDKEERRYSTSSSSSSSSSSTTSSCTSSLPSSPSNNDFYYQSILPSLKSIDRSHSNSMIHKIQLPPLQSSPWYYNHKSPLLLQPNPTDRCYPAIPMNFTV